MLRFFILDNRGSPKLKASSPLKESDMGFVVLLSLLRDENTKEKRLQ